ncbi:serine/threonine protein kinase [Litorivivens lipolytica]|uniref:Serine/threonine protein kinase n=1 Tax=Litorivivens lipolytica TaxID=1524264 RepID=A0A7W4W2J6_9GAMM|nr:serine/threonine-protein kinase [Litorivivens lipolytica]MBB3046271.1 serine/threonine protein kinase [Litorivivens lipolytica]
MNDKDKTELAKTEVSSAEDKTEVAGGAPTQLSADTTEVSTNPAKTHLSPIAPQDESDVATDTLAKMQPGFTLKERFQLGQKLGQGGMGAVFRAKDLRRVEAGHSDPTVAIKVITGDFAKDSRAFIALQRETDKSQTLAHPNIITVYDFDRDDAIFFMTMESLTGCTLDQYVISDAERAERVAYITDLANAIAYAHKRNIVHSDLKPANIFITDNNTLKVLDFGIARAYSAIEGDKTQADPDEISGLTPTYASYEMFERQPPHPADDVYALGLIAYEMLTGKHPFDRKSAPRAESTGLKPQRIKGLPGYQWKAIAKALEFRREDRWQDAGEFLRQFKGAGRRVKQLSLTLLVAIVGFSTYLLFFQPEAGPDVPFEALPPATQEQVLRNLNDGRQAMSFGDYNGALFYLDKAYELHPRNPDVMEAITAMLEEILANMPSSDDPEERAFYRQQLNELLKYPSLSQNPQLLELQKSLSDST